MLGKILVTLLALSSVAYCDERIRFIFYFGSVEFIETATFNVNTLPQIVQHPAFSSGRNTVVFHYGQGQSVSTSQVHDVITSYIFSREYNFITISYEDNTIINTDNANTLAAGIQTGLRNLFNAGYSSGRINLLGFGLGAQIVARSARLLRNANSQHLIGRLTGLDPGFLGPINAITIGRLNSGDAQWVESIHTEGSQRGDHESRGHVQFFVNGGVAQPTAICGQASPIARWDCSHVFALTIWAESVRTLTPIFPSLSCSSWETFLSGDCNGNLVGHLGRTTESNLRGPYFLLTNNVAPYSRNRAQP